MKNLFTIVFTALIFQVFSQTTEHRVNSELARTVAAKIITQVTGAKADYRTLQPVIIQSAREQTCPRP